MTWEPEPTDWPRPRREPSETDAHVRDLIPAYVNDTLAPGEYGRVVAHLRRCAGCRAGLKSWEAIAQTVRAAVATNAPASDPLLQRVMLALDEPAAWVDDFAASPSLFAKPEPVPSALPAIDSFSDLPTPANPTLATHARAPSATARPRSRVSGRRRPIMAELSAATVLVLIVAGLVASFRLAPDDERVMVPGAVGDATPSADAAVTVLGPDQAINFAECSTEPRPAGRVAALVGTEARTAPVLPDPLSEVDAPAGPEPSYPDRFAAELPRADGSARAGIQDTLRELTACRFYALVAPGRGLEPRPGWHDSRYYALFSDDFFRRYAVQPGTLGPSPTGYGLVVDWTPTGPGPVSLGDARVLPDGRVLTLVRLGAPDPPLLVVFAKPGDRWLVDELHGLDDFDSSVLATPPAPPPQSPLVEVGLWDDTEIWWPLAPRRGFSADEGVVVSVANLGTHPQRLEIEPLGYVVVVQPGQSVDLLLHVSAGTYRVRSFVENGEDRSVPALDAELVLVDDGTPPPPFPG